MKKVKIYTAVTGFEPTPALGEQQLAQYIEQKSNEHQKDMRNTITALKLVP